MLTPTMVHYGSADKVLAKRQKVLDAAYDAHPERFVSNPPTPPPQPNAVWINPPLTTGEPRDANQPLIETIGQEDLTDEENDLGTSPLTTDLNLTRPMSPVQIDLSLNKSITQLDQSRDEPPGISQESPSAKKRTMLH
jgi:hypothetical protein